MRHLLCTVGPNAQSAPGPRSSLVTSSTPQEHTAPGLVRANLLRWLYVGRLTLVTGILVAALVSWFDARRPDTVVVIVLLLLSVCLTAGSFWVTHVRRSEPSGNFLYAQVIFDALLVTGIVHLTGGPDSGFASLYVLVISAGALLLPLFGGLLIGGLSSILYSADLVRGFAEPFTIFVGLRVILFLVVAMVILTAYHWWVNLRELEDALKSPAVVSSGSVVGPDALPDRVRQASPPRRGASDLPSNPTMEVVGRAYILWVLQPEGGNETRAAEVLGIDPSTLDRKLNRYGIEE